MRKIFGEIIVCLLFVFTLLSINNINVNGYTDRKDSDSQFSNLSLSNNYDYDKQYESFLQAYYENLKYNFGMNYQGSCGYVALGMMLSYYDTFLNDDIIPEQYDVISNGTSTDIYSRFESPGTLKDVITDPDNPQNGFHGRDLTPEEYLDAIIEKSGHSLHSKLIYIGYGLGLYNMDASEDESYCGTIATDIIDVLDYYFVNVTDFNEIKYNIDECFVATSDEVKDYTIQKIQEGYPVYLSIGSDDSNHAVIAYDYDEDTDSIYCHMGHNANSTHVTPESEGYNIYNNAFVIDWNLSHKHSNNYTVISTETNTVTYYCYDDPSLSILSHTCIYNESYEMNSSNNHKAYCICKDFILQSHSLVNGICSKCEHTHQHNYGLAMYYNNLYHKSTCLCGEYILQYHVVNTENLNRCVVCNEIINNSYNMLSGNIEFITNNGSYRLPNGIIVLTNSDLKRFMSNNLNLS